jgi:hypothetical protein
MFGRARILLTIMASALVMPAVAQTPAPTTTVFDGTYLGVSRKFEEEALNGGTNLDQVLSRIPPQYVKNSQWHRSSRKARRIG